LPLTAARDPGAEANVEAVIDLIRGVRNARAEAGVDPGAWLPVHVAAGPEAGAAIEGLEVGVGRLARARPLVLHPDRAALHAAVPDGGLTVIVGDAEAVVVPSVTEKGSEGRDRARLERELGQAEALLAAARGRLDNPEFTGKAPPAVVEGARARERELADQVARLRERLSASRS
jgi:valyl-tRNA synthetase